MKSLTSFSTKRIDDILAAITENGNNIAKLVPMIQERAYQEDRRETVDEYRKAEIARNNILLVIKNQQDERQLRDQERRGTQNVYFLRCFSMIQGSQVSNCLNRQS
jgi:antitoxin (DNA-binding transcriptional repressor) of toxin-antitoxin stability system